MSQNLSVLAKAKTFSRSLENSSERKFLGKLLANLKPVLRLSTPKWAWEKRTMTSTESSIAGRFDCNRTPAFEYLYVVTDNWFIHIVGLMKSSQIGASEVENNIIGRKMDLDPCNAVVFFPGTNLLKEYSRKRFKPFFDACKTLRDKCNIGVAKPPHDFFTFTGGSLALKTLGSIQSVLSSPLPFIIYEEFAQVKADVAKQGDPLGLGIGRQKSFFIGMKKVLGFSTPTFKDFCNMEKLFNKGNKLVFKAKCHKCEGLIELSGWTMDEFLRIEEYPERYIDPVFGKFDPMSATFACTACGTPWTFEEKTKNIIEGKKFGWIDDCGDFSLGWHSTRNDWINPDFPFLLSYDEYKSLEPTIDKAKLKRKLKETKTSLVYTMQYPEILSCFEATSDAVALAIKKLLADQALEKGDETLAKDYANNSKGIPYASGITALEVDQMKALRKNYPEGVSPMDGLVLTCGIDAQHNRMAIVVLSWGRRDNAWLVKWIEIFGDFRHQEWDEAERRYKGAWGELSDYVLEQQFPHAGGKMMFIEAISIDSSDNSELIYNWVNYANNWLAENGRSPQVRATKGVRDLRYSEDEIYSEPSVMEIERDKQLRKTLYETKGVTLYLLGAHRAHEFILNMVTRNTIPEATSGILYFNHQSYGGFEEQILSCRKVIDMNSSYVKPIFKLIAGKRRESMDSVKNSLHAAFAIGLRNYTNDNWRALEKYYYNL